MTVGAPANGRILSWADYFAFFAGRDQAIPLTRKATENAERASERARLLARTMAGLGMRAEVMSMPELATVTHLMVRGLGPVSPIQANHTDPARAVANSELKLLGDGIYTNGRFLKVISLVQPPKIDDVNADPLFFMRRFTRFPYDYYISTTIELTDTKKLQKEFLSNARNAYAAATFLPDLLAEVFRISRPDYAATSRTLAAAEDFKEASDLLEAGVIRFAAVSTTVWPIESSARRTTAGRRRGPQ
ncbi:MAG: hypothetical protein KatS3mg082_1471 [Nitrospiraceae bacterium]|nr:MAG: hypothetical protein KatS3mg082_1471 [Nitrospiraceae bacterium]